jgi:hypothetical protein
MSGPSMLRVRPADGVGDRPVPLEDGSRLSRANCPAEGKLVRDTIYVRRRVLFGELEIVAEGAAALPPPDKPAAAVTTPTPAPAVRKDSAT